jgi:hypothetical protein
MVPLRSSRKSGTGASAKAARSSLRSASPASVCDPAGCGGAASRGHLDRAVELSERRFQHLRQLRAGQGGRLPQRVSPDHQVGEVPVVSRTPRGILHLSKSHLSPGTRAARQDADHPQPGDLGAKSRGTPALNERP